MYFQGCLTSPAVTFQKATFSISMTKDEIQIPQRFHQGKAMQRFEHERGKGAGAMMKPAKARGKPHSPWHQTDLSLALVLMIPIHSLDSMWVPASNRIEYNQDYKQT